MDSRASTDTAKSHSRSCGKLNYWNSFYEYKDGVDLMFDFVWPGSVCLGFFYDDDDDNDDDMYKEEEAK